MNLFLAHLLYNVPEISKVLENPIILKILTNLMI